MNDPTTRDLEVAERRSRKAETTLMIGRLSGLARRESLTSGERIGVSLAQQVLEQRLQEIRAADVRAESGHS
jgi:hypothetical protein